MQIDLFTFVAQVVNFIVLVVLLRTFLYKPVIKAMAKRKAQIGAQFHEAERRTTEAEERAAEYESKKDEIESRKEEIVQEATEEAQRRRDELIEQARDDAEERRRAWVEAVDSQRDRFLGDLKRLTVEHIVGALRSVLSGLADAELEEQIAHTFCRRLSEVDEEDAGKLPDRLSVKSSFELDDRAKKEIRETLEHIGKENPTVDFVVDNEMSFGVEIDAEHLRISWTVESYLDELRSEIEQRINREADREQSA